MTRRRLMVVVGTRPEAIKLAPLIRVLKTEAASFHVDVCTSGQHREMLDPILDWFSIKPDIDLRLMQQGQQAGDFAAAALSQLGSAIDSSKPDAVVIQGDTTTAAMAALAAFYRSVPVAHVEAGLRTYNLAQPFPEEANRRIAGLVTTLHFAPTEKARQALLAERIVDDSVFMVGNTVVDALKFTLARMQNNEIPGVPNGIDLRPRFILVTAHRRESFGLPFEQMCHAIRDIADRNQEVDIVYPVHLNPNVQAVVSSVLAGHSRIRLIEPLRYEQFVLLMSRCHLILTDSGGVQEEATVLGKPTLIMRETTERPEAVECGTAMLVGTNQAAIVSNVERLLEDRNAFDAMAKARSPFGDGHAAERIAEVLDRRIAPRHHWKK